MTPKENENKLKNIIEDINKKEEILKQYSDIPNTSEQNENNDCNNENLVALTKQFGNKDKAESFIDQIVNIAEEKEKIDTSIDVPKIIQNGGIENIEQEGIEEVVYSEDTIKYINQIENENKLIERFKVKFGGKKLELDIVLENENEQIDNLLEDPIEAKLNYIEIMLLETLKQVNMELIDLQKKMEGYTKPAPRVVMAKTDLIKTKMQLYKQLADIQLQKKKLNIQSQEIGDKNNIMQILKNKDLILSIASNKPIEQNGKDKTNKNVIDEFNYDFLDEPLIE